MSCRSAGLLRSGGYPDRACIMIMSGPGGPRSSKMLRALRNTWRLLRLALSLARHDALFPLEILGIAPALIAWARLFARRRDARRPGERLTAALQEIGPSFIKLGQALSTRADLLSEAVAID